MKPLPKKIIRLDDGAEFLLDEKTNKYELWLPGFEGHLHHQYDFETLMQFNVPNQDPFFKVADGSEDVLKMKRDWFKKIHEQTGYMEDDD